MGSEPWSNKCHQSLALAASLLLSELDNFQVSVYPSMGEAHGANAEYYPVLFGQGEPGMSVVGNSCLTVAKNQKYTIREISPEWGYTTEATKVGVICYIVQTEF